MPGLCCLGILDGGHGYFQEEWLAWREGFNAGWFGRLVHGKSARGRKIRPADGPAPSFTCQAPSVKRKTDKVIPNERIAPLPPLGYDNPVDLPCHRVSSARPAVEARFRRIRHEPTEGRPRRLCRFPPQFAAHSPILREGRHPWLNRLVAGEPAAHRS